jgi:hypothetical protein
MKLTPGLLKESHQGFIGFGVFGSLLNGCHFSLQPAQVVGHLPDAVIEVTQLGQDA